MARLYGAVIIGGGIVGAACAYELARAGIKVAIIEERGIGSGATNAGMGHLVVLDDSDAQFALSRFSLELWREIAGELPGECKYWRCGTLWVAANERELEIARNRFERYNRGGLNAELLDAEQIADAEPNLRRGLAGALLIADDAAVHPASVARFLAKQSGAELISKRAAHITDGEVRLDDDSHMKVGAVINATGTAAAMLTPGLPIRARKGHILAVDPGPDFARHQIVELGYLKSTHAEEGDSIAFNVRQDKDGEMLIGSSRQYGVEDPEVDRRVINRLLTRATEYMPRLEDCRELRSWTGFRAGTPDGLPLIGRCRGFERVYAATGHEGLGATTSLGTARLLADQILGRVSQIDAVPFSPARF